MKCACRSTAEERSRAEFEKVWTDNAERVFRIVRTRVERREDAEDLCGSVMFKAFANFSTLERRDNPFLWLRQIALNEVRQFYRRHDVPTVPIESPMCAHIAADSAELPEMLALQGSHEAIVWTALTKLPQELREIVVMHYYDGLTYGEIAEAKQMPRNTVASTLSRARA